MIPLITILIKYKLCELTKLKEWKGRKGGAEKTPIEEGMVWNKGLYPDGGYIVSTENLVSRDKSIYTYRNPYYVQI